MEWNEHKRISNHPLKSPTPIIQPSLRVKLIRIGTPKILSLMEQNGEIHHIRQRRKIE
jgi:hypothetical protein